ncbi:MAG: NACHT domain-containing protein [Nostoc sp.]|uniref:NACHT domain-containing protein n=1 Tax=Nostoc sp. TaxID=1180 RepID=UPI002FF0F250
MTDNNFANRVEIFGGKVQGFIQENYGTVTQNFIIQVSKLYSSQAVTEKELNSEEYRQRTVLLSKVKEYWIKGVLEKSLFTEAMIELGLEERSDIIERPFIGFEELSEKSRKILPTGTDATEFFNQIGDGRTLLILGEPGSGKTITLLKLAQNLIARAEEDIRRLIPIVFNLSSWKIKRQKIADWLIEELWSKYGVSKAVGKDLIEKQQLIMLLDGLDEVKAEHREACVQAINQFMVDNGQTEVVVCSRIKEYEALSTQLRLRGAILIRSLTPEQINQYFDKAGEQLQAVKTLLQEDNALQELAKSPLTLSVMSLAYRGKKVEELHQIGSLEERRQHLFDSYIERMFKQEKTGKPSGYKYRYENQQTKKWLTWLAQRMTKESQTVFLIEQLQPRWLKTKSEKILYVLAVVLFIFLVLNSWNFYLDYLSQVNPSVILEEKKLSESQLTNFKEIFARIERLRLIFIFLLLTIVMSWKLIINKPFFLCTWVKKVYINFVKKMFFVKYLVPLYELYKLQYDLLFRNYLVPDIEPIEAVNWSFRNALKTLKSNLIAFFVCSTIFVIIPFGIIYLVGLLFLIWNGQISNGLLLTLLFVVIVPLLSVMSGLLSAIVNGPTVFVFSSIDIKKSVEKTVVPNQGIKRSAKSIIPLSFMGLVLGFLSLYQSTAFQSIYGTMFTMLLHHKILPVHIPMPIGIVTKILTWVLLFALLAGGACIKHVILRIILCWKGYMPWNYASFLDYASERIFLRKVGGSYIFIHRILQEYFAFRETALQSSGFYAPIQEIPVQPSSPQVQNHLVCTNCGHHNSANNNFCIKCGTKLNQPHI